MYPVLGIDVAKATLAVALQVRCDQLVSHEFANSAQGHAQLIGWLTQQLDGQPVGALHICLEATGRYGQAVAEQLWAVGYQVSLVNPSRIHAYAKSKLRRSKTDKADAQLIADFCATQAPPPWQPPSAQQQTLQELTRHLESLKQERTRTHNRLKAGVRSHWVQRDLQSQAHSLAQRIAELEREIAAHTQQEETHRSQMALLTSIPGIGQLTAARFLAEVADVHQFAQAGHLAAYAGLVPSEHTSGTSVQRKPKLCKTGNPHLRTAFYLPALNAARFNPLVRALVKRLEAKGKPKMVIVAAAMRKLLHLAYGVLKSGQPFDANYAVKPSPA
jgi:transposase